MINQFAIHFISFSVIKQVDVFSRPKYTDIIVESLTYCHKKKVLNIHAWAIMFNHTRLICSARELFFMSDIMREFKKIYFSPTPQRYKRQSSRKPKPQDVVDI